jgi:hypothetical protein
VIALLLELNADTLIHTHTYTYTYTFDTHIHTRPLQLCFNIPVGVPVIAPLFAFSDNPLGRLGVTVNLSFPVSMVTGAGEAKVPTTVV